MKPATLLVGGTQGYVVTGASFTCTQPNKGHLTIAYLHGMDMRNKLCWLIAC